MVRKGGRFIARADFAWPAAKLVVEIDGFGPHSGRDAFQRDRRRQNALVNESWKVLRFTVDDIRNDPWRVIHEIRQALGLADSSASVAKRLELLPECGEKLRFGGHTGRRRGTFERFDAETSAAGGLR